MGSENRTDRQPHVPQQHVGRAALARPTKSVSLDSHNARTTGWLRRDPNARNPTTGALINPPGRHTDVNGDGTMDWIPEIPRYILDRRETKRPAFMGIVEWQPNDDVKLFAEGTYAQGERRSQQHVPATRRGGRRRSTMPTAQSGRTTRSRIWRLTSTTAFPIDLAYRNINGSLEREQYTTAIGGEWDLGQFKLDGRVTYASAEVQNDEKNSTATIFGVPRAIIDYAGSERAPNFTFPGLDTTTGQGVNQLAAVFNPRTNTQEETSVQFNVEYQPDIGWLTSLKAGVDVRTLTMDSILFQRTIQLSSRTPPPASAGATTTVAVPQSTIPNIIDTFSGVNDIGFFATGDLGFGGGIRLLERQRRRHLRRDRCRQRTRQPRSARIQSKSGHQQQLSEFPGYLGGGGEDARRLRAGLVRVSMIWRFLSAARSVCATSTPKRCRLDMTGSRQALRRTYRCRFHERPARAATRSGCRRSTCASI